MRVIVFGSRDWPLEHYSYIHARIWNLPEGTTVVHGACPSGVDYLADRVATARGLQIERHPANWSELGKAAGPRRNAHMASLGADLAIGFRAPGASRGTDNMEAEALLRGITVERHGWGWRARW